VDIIFVVHKFAVSTKTASCDKN